MVRARDMGARARDMGVCARDMGARDGRGPQTCVSEVQNFLRLRRAKHVCPHVPAGRARMDSVVTVDLRGSQNMGGRA